MRIAWCTDIHLDQLKDSHNPSLADKRIESFCDKINEHQADGVLITGDISTGRKLVEHLASLEKHIIPDIPIWFVLGNHDYYDSSIEKVRKAVTARTSKRMIWLNNAGVVHLTETVALVGHDGWYDGGYSNWFQSRLMMPEYFITEDFAYKDPTRVHARLQELAQECADHIHLHVKAAAERYKHVLFGTHVPCFRNNSRAPGGALSDHEWLPNMSSKRAGDAMLEVAYEHPDVQFTVLSGHTHTSWNEDYLDNLREITGKSSYGRPEVSIQVLGLDSKVVSR